MTPRGRSRARAITSETDFQRVFRQGRVVRGAHLVAHAADREGELPGRFAVVISRKHGNAVRRNRIRRRIRELMRQFEGSPSGVDVVIVAKAGTGDLSFSEISDELQQIMEKVGKAQAKTP